MTTEKRNGQDANASDAPISPGTGYRGGRGYVQRDANPQTPQENNQEENDSAPANDNAPQSFREKIAPFIGETEEGKSGSEAPNGTTSENA